MVCTGMYWIDNVPWDYHINLTEYESGRPTTKLELQRMLSMASQSII